MTSRTSRIRTVTMVRSLTTVMEMVTILLLQLLQLVHLIASKFKLFMPLIYTAADFPEVTKDFFNSNRSNLYDQMIKDSVGQQVENNIKSTLEELRYKDEASGYDEDD